MPPPVQLCTDYLVGEILIYPAPGATAVPVGIRDLIVSIPADGTFELTSSGGAIALGTSIPVPSPAPTTLPTSSPGSPVLTPRAVPVPMLSPATTYIVQYQPPKTTNPCGSHESAGAIGTFST